MHNLPYSRDKFVPLRRFAYDGLYNLAYLSQLVQRGKLKARKIGKNYNTTREWFEEYLETHALDQTREAYREVFRQVDQKQALIDQKIAQGKYKAQPIPGQISFLNKIILKRAMISVIALFVLLTGLIFGARYLDRSGQIAGEQETATTTKGVMDSSNSVTPDAQMYYEKN